MRRKNDFFVLFFVIVLAVLVPAIKYGRASLLAVESDSKIPVVSAASISVSLPSPTATNIPREKTAPSETSTSLNKKTEKRNTAVLKKIKPKVATTRKIVQKSVKSASFSVPTTAISVSVQKSVPCDGISDFDEQFLCLINNHRAENGRDPLSYSAKLSETARLHSKWMSETGITNHIGKDGSKFYERCVAQDTACLAENIAMGFTSASNLFELWKNSPGHNANMLGHYTLLGLGIYGEHATTLFR